MRTRRPWKTYRPAGMTLIEVIAALAITVFLLAGVYGIAQAAMTLSRASNEARGREMQLNNLVAFLRDGFEKMPSYTEVELTAASKEGGTVLTLRKAPGMLSWNSRAAGADTVILHTEPDPKTEGAMRLILEHGSYSGASGAGTIERLPLLNNLKDLRFHLYDGRGSSWQAAWNSNQGRPLMLEMTFQLAEQPGPQRLVFWIPRLVDTLDGRNLDAMGAPLPEKDARP